MARFCPAGLAFGLGREFRRLPTRFPLGFGGGPLGRPLQFSRGLPLITAGKMLFTAVHGHREPRQPNRVNLIIIQRTSVRPDEPQVFSQEI
jgi:hypothetical protein